MFTAWLGRDIVFDKTKRRSVYNSPPGNWIDRGEGQSYVRRAREAMENGWACRLIALEGIATKEKVKSADFDDRFYAVWFTKVEDDGTIQGDLLTMTEFNLHPAK